METLLSRVESALLALLVALTLDFDLWPSTVIPLLTVLVIAIEPVMAELCDNAKDEQK